MFFFYFGFSFSQNSPSYDFFLLKKVIRLETPFFRFFKKGGNKWLRFSRHIKGMILKGTLFCAENPYVQKHQSLPILNHKMKIFLRFLSRVTMKGIKPFFFFIEFKFNIIFSLKYHYWKKNHWRQVPRSNHWLNFLLLKPWI